MISDQKGTQIFVHSLWLTDPILIAISRVTETRITLLTGTSEQARTYLWCNVRARSTMNHDSINDCSVSTDLIPTLHSRKAHSLAHGYDRESAMFFHMILRHTNRKTNGQGACVVGDVVINIVKKEKKIKRKGCSEKCKAKRGRLGGQMGMEGEVGSKKRPMSSSTIKRTKRGLTRNEMNRNALE